MHVAGQEKQAQVGRLEALRAVARQADAEDETAATARARAAALAGDLDRTRAEALRRQAARPQAEQARDAAGEAAGALPAARERANAARQVASDCAALVAEHAKRSELREAHLTAREKSLAAQAGALRIRGARIDGMRAELAAEMTDGSPCPVCGSLDHPDPVDAASFPPVSRDEEDAAVKLASDAALAADEAGQRVAAVGAVLGDLTRRLSAAGFALPAGPAGPVDLNSGTLAIAAGTAEADANEREAEAGLLGAAAARLTSLQRELDELDTAIAADNARLTELAGQRTAALAEAGAADARAAARRAELTARLGDAGDLEAAIGAAADLAEALAKAAAVADLLADPDLKVELDPPAAVDETTGAAGAAQAAHAAAVDAHGQARLRADQLAELRPRLEAALGALRPLQERAGRSGT